MSRPSNACGGRTGCRPDRATIEPPAPRPAPQAPRWDAHAERVVQRVGDHQARVVWEYASRLDLSALYADAAESILKQTGIKRGYCLVIGSEQGRLGAGNLRGRQVAGSEG